MEFTGFLPSRLGHNSVMAWEKRKGHMARGVSCLRRQASRPDNAPRRDSRIRGNDTRRCMRPLTVVSQPVRRNDTETGNRPFYELVINWGKKQIISRGFPFKKVDRIRQLTLLSMSNGTIKREGIQCNTIFYTICIKCL